MGTLLSAAEITDIRRQIAPQLGDDICEVWRMPRTQTVIAGGGGVGKYGTAVKDGIDPLRLDLRAQKMRTLYARKSQAMNAQEPMMGGQSVTLQSWIVSFNGGDNPDIQGGDWLVFAAKRVERQALSDLGWKPSIEYSINAHEQPTVSNGNEYRALSGGVSGVTQPTWPIRSGDTVTDGTIEWLCIGKRLRLEVVNPGGEGTTYINRIVQCKYAGLSESRT